jgi:amidohydrolase
MSDGVTPLRGSGLRSSGLPSSKPALKDPKDLNQLIRKIARQLEPELIEFRRDLHAHPEPSREEIRTTANVYERLQQAGLEPRLLDGTGLICDLGTKAGPRTAIRADIDALPLVDTCERAWQSTNEGWTHGCGHDVHTTVILGTGLVLRELENQGIEVPRTRLIFQPAEEVFPGGSLTVMAQGGLNGISRIASLHCEPKLEVGKIATRVGPITSATDEVEVTLVSTGGHTSRPHLTGDVVFALGEVITQVPSVLGRRLDPRSGVNLTWGMVHAGEARNAIPAEGMVAGTLRCLDVRAWERAGHMLDEAITQVVTPYSVDVTLRHVRGVPPVENDLAVTNDLMDAARAVVYPENVEPTEQSLGGEDFAWYLTKVPGAMIRLGTRAPGAPLGDLHQGALDVDEDAIEIGVRVFTKFIMG